MYNILRTSVGKNPNAVILVDYDNNILCASPEFCESVCEPVLNKNCAQCLLCNSNKSQTNKKITDLFKLEDRKIFVDNQKSGDHHNQPYRLDVFGNKVVFTCTVPAGNCKIKTFNVISK